MLKKIQLICVCLLLQSLVMAQQNVHPQSATYEWPTEPDVKAKLEKWQDLKFGIIIHWGLYAVPGIMESWNLCSEEWIDRDSNIAYEDYKKWYWGQSQKFNPVNFNPNEWAKTAKEAGMRYLVFTTKHHDGFNMFDTKRIGEHRHDVSILGPKQVGQKFLIIHIKKKMPLRYVKALYKFHVYQTVGVGNAMRTSTTDPSFSAGQPLAISAASS